MQHLVLSMRNKDLAGIDEFCTSRGRHVLEDYVSFSEFKNSGMYVYVINRGFHFDARKHTSWDVWQAWAQRVDVKNMRRDQTFSNVDSGDVVLNFQTAVDAFISTKSFLGAWEFDRTVSFVVR
jgi:hypothetical protein